MLRIAYKPCSDLPPYKPDVAFGHPPSNLSHIKPWEEDLGTKKEILIFQLQLQDRDRTGEGRRTGQDRTGTGTGQRRMTGKVKEGH